jgi:small-conductance mechanosensitive channel
MAFSEILLAHSPSPLDGGTWERAWAEFGELDSELRRTGRLLGSGAVSFFAMLALALGVAGAIKLSGLAARGLLNRYGQAVGHVDPTYRQRVRAACIVAFSLGVVPAVLFVGWLSLIWYGLERYHVLAEQTIKPVGISLGIVFYFLFSALARAVLRPTTPAWRLIPISTESARILSRRIELLVLVLAVDVPFWRLLEMAGRPPAMSSVHTFVLSLALLLVTLSLLPRHLWRWQAVSTDESALSETDARSEAARTLTSWLAGRWFAAAVFGGAWIASVFGYGNLGAYLTRGMLRMLLLLVVVMAVRGVVRETLTLLLTGHETRPREGFGVLNFWLITFSDLILSILGVIGTLLSWGVPWTGLLSAIHTAIGGFTVGTYRVVPADILLGVLVFSALVLLTRFLQRQLEERILPKAHLDIGARTAIAAVTGYLGIGLAFVAAISIIGIDLSHLALIAGALSVGIGFGLQNIVNNFISGAILLAERPIKIGDWIVVGNIEGNVRRINIRATEIETFNRASVIVPNADLLQTSVTNWTYKNRRGRVDIPLGVDYKSDPDEIEAILLECAKQHASVLDWPAPYVLLQLFGDSSLDFELRVFVADIEQRHIVSSDLRKAVLRVFRSRGIEIPFPQRDVWVRVDQNGPEQPQADPLELSGSRPAG